MHNFVICNPFKSVSALVRTNIAIVRKIAFMISIVGFVIVGAAAGLSTSMPERTGLIFIMGGTLAATPFVFARALEEAMRDDQ